MRTRSRLRAAARRWMLTADGLVPAGVGDARRLQVERQMLDLLARGVREALLTSIVIGPLLTTWLTLPHIGVARAVLPLLLLLSFGVERAFLLRRIARERALCDDTPRRWANALGVRLLMGNSVVLLWFHFVVESGNTILISEMVALLTILAAGGSALFSSWPPVMWVVVSPLLLGMAVQLGLTGEPERLVQMVFCIVLWIVLVSANLRAARTLHSEALERLRNQDLVRELHEKHAQAEAANVAKSRFFAAANHDLRQPLQAMRLYLGLLPPSPDASDTRQRLNQCMAALDQRLESLLDLSHMDSGRLTPAPRAVALQPLLSHLAGVHGAVARQKRLQLRLRATGAWAQTDPALLERALSNLLANALRYTQRGGVLLAVRRRGDGWRVCVFDTGAGIQEQAQESIWEEFVQLGNPERDPAQGHGLGLATVRRIAGLLGHPLGLRSRTGRGSVFTIDVPAAQPGSVPAPEPDAAPDAPARLRGRVLVVEDHALIRDALTRQLGSWGLQVRAVGNGPAALAALAEDEGFDAVLSDWRLPGEVDGVAVLRHARARLPKLKLAALITGESVQALDQLKREFPVLRKPLRPLQMRALLARQLRQD